MTDRPHCRSRDDCKAKTALKHCRACAAAHNAKRPERRAKVSARMKEFHQDPERRAKHLAGIRKSAAEMSDERREIMRQCGLTVGARNLRRALERGYSPESIAKRVESCRDRKMAWCPKPYRALYSWLRKAKALPMPEARAIVEDAIERDTRLSEADRLNRMFAAAEAPARPERRQAFSRVYTQTLGGVA